jgi:hypothetical protein
MTRNTRNTRRAAVVAALLGALVAPAAAQAHGLAGRAAPGIPSWLFAWGAAVVLVLSFVALSVLWRQPKLQQLREHGHWSVPRFLDPLCGLIGVALFAGFVYAGLEGSQDELNNIAPTTVYVVFWVATPLLSIIVGDLFRPFNPWRAIARFVGFVSSKIAGDTPVAAPTPYPAWLGRWPVVIGIVAFGWMELVYTNRDDPKTLATVALAYAAVQLVAMSFFGREQWERQGDAFGVYFGIFARMSPLDWRDGRVWTRRPLEGVVQLDITPGTVALILAGIGVTTFDGLSAGPLWTDVAPKMQTWFTDIGFSPESALEVVFSIGLAFAIAVVSLFYWVGIRGVHSVDPSFDRRELSRRFIHTLVPIAAAYVLAHYFSLLAWQGQGMIYLLSDPLGNGANYLGTSNYAIDYAIVGFTAVWYVQVAALVAGHVAGLTLAHDRAIATYRDVQTATRSQYWMLVVMVGFTSLGLWLLASASS